MAWEVQPFESFSGSVTTVARFGRNWGRGLANVSKGVLIRFIESFEGKFIEWKCL